MTKPTEPAAPDQTVDDLITEAFGAARVLPPYERCRELDQLLRDAIGDLSADAQAAEAETVRHSRDWWRLHNALTDTDHVLAEDLGAGLLSAAIHVGALARQAQALCNALRGQP